MAGKAKQTRTARKLVIGHLERIASNVFSDFPKELTALIGEQHGVYALYKGDRLYYVGLASNLRNRIKHHLRDRHQAKWNAFSLYLVRKADHLKELESIILRIADPRGNKTAGRLRHAKNLKSALQSRIKAAQARQMRQIMGGGRVPPPQGARKASRKPKKEQVAKKSKVATLAPYVSKRFMLRATYKGKAYKAWIRKDGTIQYDGNVYTSPSNAARAVVGRRDNGWGFWRFRNKDGEWVKLRELRTKT